jgi:hypothetical protein
VLNSGYRPLQDALEKAARLSGCCPDQAADSAPRSRTPFSSYVLVLTGLTLHKDGARCGRLNAIQENGVPRAKQKRQQDAGVTGCWGDISHS